jgi:outer membrane protein
MKNFRIAVIAALALAGLSVSAAAQQPVAGAALPDGKIAVLNTTLFRAQIFELKQKYDQVETKFKDRLAKLETIKQEITKLTNELQAQANVLPIDKQREKQDRIEQLRKQGTREQEDLNTEVEREVDAATKPVRDKLYQFLNNYCTRNSIVMVISLAEAAQSGTLAFWHPTADITDDFIKQYNQANPVAGGAPATAPATRPPATTTPATKPPAKPNGNQ